MRAAWSACNCRRRIAPPPSVASRRNRHSTAGDPPPWVAALIADIQKYCAGEKIDFSAVAVDLGGIDDFRQKLYAALRGIGFGRTVTYGDLAKQLGLSGWEGARDVGEAMGSNRVPIVIPCHRVLAAGNKPGGFSAYGGITTKQKLLALEGVSLEPEKKPDNEPPRLPGLLVTSPSSARFVRAPCGP